MNEIEKHIGTLNQMQSHYSHIRHNDDEFMALEASKEALREQFEAAVEDMKRMDRYIAENADPCAALCEACRHKPRDGEECKRCDVYDNTGFEWRGGQGEKGEEGCMK